MKIMKDDPAPTKYGLGTHIELDGDEVATAIDQWLAREGIKVQGSRTIRLTDPESHLATGGASIYVDPSGSVQRTDVLRHRTQRQWANQGCEDTEAMNQISAILADPSDGWRSTLEEIAKIVGQTDRIAEELERKADPLEDTQILDGAASQNGPESTLAQGLQLFQEGEQREGDPRPAIAWLWKNASSLISSAFLLQRARKLLPSVEDMQRLRIEVYLKDPPVVRAFDTLSALIKLLAVEAP